MRQRGLAENSLLALSGDVCSKVAALAVVLVAARAFSVPEFALLATGLAAAGLLSAVLDLGAGTLLTRDGTAGSARRGELLLGVLHARVPLVVSALVLAPLLGLVLARPLVGLAVTALGVTGALALTVLGAYRSCQDIRPEALQKLVAAGLSVAGAAVVAILLPRADVVLAWLALVLLVTLLPLVLRLRRIAELGGRVGSAEALRLMVPIGLLALATVAYYRAGTLVLAVLSDAKETAAFGVAASIAFGMLMLPNAITTALLPRLSAGRGDGVVTEARRALAWTVLVATCLAAAAAAAVPVGLPLVLGPPYEAAGLPFVLLCAGIPVIAASGVIGTSLLSVGKLRPLGVQVAVSLAVNLALLAVLVPRLGAVGAALATVACELVGLALLMRMSREALPGLVALRRPGTRREVRATGAVTP